MSKMYKWIFIAFLGLLSAITSNTLYAEQAHDPEKLCLPFNEIPHSRPEREEGATKVAISLYVIDIERIDTLDQDFLADFLVVLRWHDPRLIERRTELKAENVCNYPLSRVWNPLISIFNARGLQKQLEDEVSVDAQGDVKYRQRYYGPLSAPLNLKKFPFDIQKLPINLVSIGYDRKHIKLEFMPERTGRSTDLSILNWEIDKGAGQLSTYVARSAHDASVKAELPMFSYIFTADRHLNYYIWKIILPLVLIVLMSWAVFWINPIKIEVQVALSATSILTLIAFLFSLTELLPKISYLTAMDYFIFLCLVAVFGAFIEAISTCSLALNGKVEKSLRIDKRARIIFPSTFGIALVLILLYAIT